MFFLYAAPDSAGLFTSKRKRDDVKYFEKGEKNPAKCSYTKQLTLSGNALISHSILFSV